MRKKNSGFTLIELLLFIIIMSIAAATILLSFRTLLTKSPNANRQTTALELAEGRMDIILGQYYQNGFSSFGDICPGAAVCMSISGYSVNSSITDNGNSKTITVTTSGLGDAILTIQVWN
jgi:prepilin-type N-terminal cleavage/methylation domain-containing protein